MSFVGLFLISSDGDDEVLAPSTTHTLAEGKGEAPYGVSEHFSRARVVADLPWAESGRNRLEQVSFKNAWRSILHNMHLASTDGIVV